jgi:hypothetical protein
MLRSRIKLGTLVSGLAVASLLTTPAGAQNPTVAPAGTNVPPPDVRARMWAATARFVYADDPALANMRPQLRQTIDSGSVSLFGRHLEDAVKLEKKLQPKLEHVLKFQGDFKNISVKNEPASQLAASIIKQLHDNKPERQGQAGFTQLSRTLNALADPNPPVAAATPPASAPDTTEAAAQPATVATPAKTSDFTTTSPPSSPMLTWVPWVALALSILSLLVSLFKGNSPKRRPHSHGPSSSSLTSLTDEMKAEVHLIVQREVSKKVPGARPAPDVPAPAQVPAQPQAPARPQAPAPAKNVPAAAPKPVQPKPVQPQAPAPVPAVAEEPVPVAASPAPAEPVATASGEDDELFNINYITKEEPVAAPPAAPATRTLYANQQPIDGIFQRNMLAEAPASYTIFELITAADAPDQARFVVTGNPAGHAGYIGSHVNILGGACEYPFPKGSVTRIITDEPGVAQRTASGDWQISKKARIHFE